MSPFQRSSLAGATLSLALLALVAAPGRAQTVVPRDTAPAASPDSIADSIAAYAPGPAPARDTAPPSTLTPQQATGPAPAPAPAPPQQPVDEVLVAACRAGGGIAEDLLVVVFQPGTEAPKQQAVARSIGGTLAGTSAQGGYYLKAPAAAAGGVNALADRVIRQPAVVAVAPAECPPVAALPDSGAGR